MSQTIIDDADLIYSGNWVHATGSSALVDGTQSYTNDPSATVSFSFTGTGFDYCAGEKADRGPFTYAIDGTSQGSGTELGSSTQQDPTCTVVASARNLTPGNHQVVFKNGGSSWFAADAVTVYNSGSTAAAATGQTSSVTQHTTTSTTSSTTSSSSSSITSSTTTQTTTSQQISLATASLILITLSSPTSSTSSIILSSGSSSSISPTAVPHSEHSSSSQVSAGKKAAMIGGPIVGGAILAVLAFFLIARYRKSRQDRDTVIEPSASGHWLDEKTDYSDARDYRYSGKLDMYEKPVAQSYSASPIQQLAGRISPISFGRSKQQLGHNRLNSEMSLESHTEPFRPASLAQPPDVEPFYIPPTAESVRSSVVPTTAAPPAASLRPQPSLRSYNQRLTAAASALPDWRLSKQSDTSYYAETVLPELPPEAHQRHDSGFSQVQEENEYSGIYAGMLGDNRSHYGH